MGRTLLAAVAAVAALRLSSTEDARLVTIAQGDAWRSYVDEPSSSVSADGRYVAFSSYAQLVPADVNRHSDIYLLDRATGAVSFESGAIEGPAAYGGGTQPDISADGRLLVYRASKMPATLPRGVLVLRNVRDATVTIVGETGATTAGSGHDPTISGDGRFVAFVSSGNPTPTPDTNGTGEDVYLFDASTGVTRRISVDDTGTQFRHGSSIGPSINGDGRFIAFTSSAPLHRLVEIPQTNDAHRRLRGTHVYVRDMQRSRTTLVSATAAGAPANGASWGASIDAAGRYVAFVSMATNLVPGDRNRSTDIFIADLTSGSIELASASAEGGFANGRSEQPALSADGMFLAFQSDASDLVCVRRCPAVAEDINLLWDVFLLDRRRRKITRVSATAAGGWMEPSIAPAIDGSGTVLAFSSRHPMGPQDTKNDFDLFVRAPRSSR